MAKLFLIFFIFWGSLSHAQSKGKFPYTGGINNLEKDINTIFVEASDSGRIYFVEIIYIKKEKKVVPIVHGATEENVTKSLITIFFQQNIDKWNKKYVKKASVIIPLFIEAYDVDKRSYSGFTNLSLQANSISKTFNTQRCILTKPFLILKSEIHIDIEN